MKSIYRKIIVESKDVKVYKKLLNVLGDYCAKNPVTGVDDLLDAAVTHGKKILPSDKRAIAIITWVLDSHSVPAAVQKLLNMSFSNLPPDLRPIMKDGRKHRVTFWARGNRVSDKVKDLIDWEGSGKTGAWTDLEGKKVSLLDLTKPEEK